MKPEKPDAPKGLPRSDTRKVDEPTTGVLAITFANSECTGQRNVKPVLREVFCGTNSITPSFRYGTEPVAFDPTRTSPERFLKTDSPPEKEQPARGSGRLFLGVNRRGESRFEGLLVRPRAVNELRVDYLSLRATLV